MSNLKNVSETEWLLQLYFEDLKREVKFGHNTRPRVYNVDSLWSTLPDHHLLQEGAKHPRQITDDDVIWVWSDNHFFHKNIIDFCERPFANVTEMNEHMVANHNELVGENDIVIWGGDVGFGDDVAINDVLDQCNGYKILIIGNHDFTGRGNKAELRHLNVDEMHVLYYLPLPTVDLVFTHYPMCNIPYPWFNVHGHLHAYPHPHTSHKFQFNMNCELHNYRPLNVKDELVNIVKQKVISYGMTT